MFQFRKTAPAIELVESEIMPETHSDALLDRSSLSVSTMLDRFRGDEIALEREITELTEKLRQTRVAITAFEAAGAIIDGGKEPDETAPTKKIGRLAPRGVPAAEADQKTIVHVHKDIRA